MTWPETWPTWQPQPGAESPGQGGMSQLAAYEAGLTDDPGAWIQPIEVYWSPRLDPRSPEYDPEFVARVEWEAGPEDAAPAQAQPPWLHTEPDAGPEPELPF
jgi:hypothetical protein